ILYVTGKLNSKFVLILFAILFGFVFVPKFLKKQFRNNLVLKPGTDLRKLWEKAPFAVTFKVYIFNITNADVVLMGGKPHVEQIGPYIFDEWKEKIDLVDNEEADTVAFDMVNTFIFRQDLSDGLTGNEIVTIPHLLIMGGLIAVQRDKEPLLEMATKAMTTIFKPKSPFLTAPVMDILFNGVGIDCSSEEFEAMSFCKALENEKPIKVVNDTYLKFSVMGGANATSMGRFEVFRGIKDIMQLGEVVKFDDEEEVDAWDGECNEIIGTDSTIFAPFHDKKDILYAFAPDLCRSLGAEYLKPSSYNHVPTGYYSMNFGDIKGDPRQHCFCRDQDVEKCPPSGTLDLYPCTGAPLIASKPQFLDADETLAKNIDGLNPNRAEHDIFLHLEMMTSTPLSAAKRLQFALDCEPVEKFELMSKLPQTVIPLMWVEESVHLNTTYTGIFRAVYIFLSVNSFIKYSTMIFGILGLTFVVYRIKNEMDEKKNLIQTVAAAVNKSASLTSAESVTKSAIMTAEKIVANGNA
ncbi:CLUMA_CG017212, isoform A, partial [Clunio marinus]